MLLESCPAWGWGTLTHLVGVLARWRAWSSREKAEQSLKLQPGFRKALVVAGKTTKVTYPREAVQIANQLIKSRWGECGGGQAQLSGQVKGSNSGLRLRASTSGQSVFPTRCLCYEAPGRLTLTWCLAQSFIALGGHEG